MKKVYFAGMVLLATSGCAAQKLQYDHGRAFQQAIMVQADLTRPSVADSAFALSGIEGLALRETVTKEASDQESGQLEAAKKVDVQ
jgi:hypothetical protein